jgi:hypothetical protein
MINDKWWRSTYGFLMQRGRMTTERLTSMWLPEAVAVPQRILRGDASSRRFATNIPALDARRGGADPVFYAKRLEHR